LLSVFQHDRPSNYLGFQGWDHKCRPLGVQQTQIPITLAELLFLFLKKFKLLVQDHPKDCVVEQGAEYRPLSRTLMSCENHVFTAGSALL